MPPLDTNLFYPLASAPGGAELIAVAPGVQWLRMPLPFALDHINLWLVEDGAGDMLVDTGFDTEACRTPVTAASVAASLFPKATGDQQYFFALGETLAHLNMLVADGVLSREADSTDQAIFHVV